MPSSNRGGIFLLARGCPVAASPGLLNDRDRFDLSMSKEVVIKPTGRRHFRLPPFAKNAKDGAPHCVDDASEIKSPGHQPRQLHEGRNEGNQIAATMSVAMRTTPSPKKKDSIVAKVCVLAPKTRPIILSLVSQMLMPPSSRWTISGSDNRSNAAAAMEITNEPTAIVENSLTSWGNFVVFPFR
jgi:hypothetical protein